jgi:predicted nucleic acid-binding protein
MGAEIFFDTNILIYAFAANEPRAELAETLLAEGGIVSVQVLGEFAHVGRNKLRRSWKEIQAQLSVLQTLLGDPEPVTGEIHRMALAVAERTSYGFYDSQIIAAALTANCKILYSEDLQHNQRIGGLTIKNPFKLARKR